MVYPSPSMVLNETKHPGTQAYCLSLVLKKRKETPRTLVLQYIVGTEVQIRNSGENTLLSSQAVIPAVPARDGASREEVWLSM